MQATYDKLFNNMLTNKDLQARLRVLGLSSFEAKVYLELLKGPSTHLELSRSTGVERAKIYRIVEQLQNRSLIVRYADDRGSFIAAADPSHLEIDLISREDDLKHQRKALKTLLPALTGAQPSSSDNFSFRTYAGQSGIKQMCWNELKTKGEIMTFGHGNIEMLTGDRRWAASHRRRQLESRYRNRDLVNEDNEDKSALAHEVLYEAELYRAAIIPLDIMRFERSVQTVVYNNTVEIFSWQEEQRMGIEIVSASYANTIRQFFERYWKLGQELSLS